MKRRRRIRATSRARSRCWRGASPAPPPAAAPRPPPAHDRADAAETAGDDVRGSRAHHRVVLARIKSGVRQPLDEAVYTAPRDHVVTTGVVQFGAKRGDRVVREIKIQ